MTWRHLSDKYVKASKQHNCFLCGELIRRGDVYIARSGIDFDGPVTIRFHIECEAETRNWEPEDWETFEGGTLERPKKTEEVRET